MIGVPEQAAIISRAILLGMINVNIDDMPGEIGHEFEPTRVAAAQVLNGRAGDNVVLIIIVRHQRLWSGMANGFMIRVEIAEMSPAIFVDNFPSSKKRLGSGDRNVDQLSALNV